MSYEAFRDDDRTAYAVTRCLEIISEASGRLPEDLGARHPAMEWREMAAAGNVCRHDYQDVEARWVWGTLTAKLPPLRLVIERELPWTQEEVCGRSLIDPQQKADQSQNLEPSDMSACK